MAWWNSPWAKGDVDRVQMDRLPAEQPKSVTRWGSPPKASKRWNMKDFARFLYMATFLRIDNIYKVIKTYCNDDMLEVLPLFRHDWLIYHHKLSWHNRKVLFRNCLWMAQITRLDVGLYPLQRHNLIIQTVHTSRTNRFFLGFSKQKVGDFLIHQKISSTESFGKEKNPLGVWNLRKKTTSNRFQEKNIRNLQFRWPHRAVWMVRIPRAQGDNWVIRRWHSVPQLVVFHSQQHHCNHPPSHQWSSHHHESKPSLVVDALIWNGVDRDPEKNNLQTSSLPVVICMHPSLSDHQLGCKESLWVALTKTCEENQSENHTDQRTVLEFSFECRNTRWWSDDGFCWMYSCSKNHQKGSDSKIEDKIDNLIHKFPDQDSNIWGLALWHQWFHFPNFPVQQLRIAWHVHSEGQGRHRQHRPVVPAKCRHPCGSREQPMHCKCQGVATSRKKCSATSQAALGQRTLNFHKVCTLGNTPMLERLFLCWFSKCAQNSEAHPTCLNVWNMIPPCFLAATIEIRVT